MSRITRSVTPGLLLGAVVGILAVASVGSAQQSTSPSAQSPAPPTTPSPAPPSGAARDGAQPPLPFAPDWGMLAGFDVFSRKGCGKCHAIRGVGGGVGPDLGRLEGAKGYFDLAAAMWNHLPRMGARMRETRTDRPQLTAREVNDLIAFLFTAQYWDELGDPKAGETLFSAKGCASCHSLGGRGGNVGPSLDPLKRANSPVLVATGMWNHGPRMAEVMKERGIARPTFTGKEMIDLIAYVVAASRDTSTETAQVVPGTPERGEKIFQERHCATCHTVGGKGGKVGPELGRAGHHESLTSFTARMWNHGPAMWIKMKERGLEVPRLSGQDMADILAYLYVSHYFDRTASASRGQQLVQDKGCLRCHSVRGKGGKAAADFATSTVVKSAAGVVAGMWNHSGLMEASAQRQEVAWPTLSAIELADVTAYVTSLGGKSRPATKGTPGTGTSGSSKRKSDNR
jgi:mono/diheme cytochrome c family protein